MADCDQILARFNRLMAELESGAVRRNCFRPWEIDLIVDLQSSGLLRSQQRRLLPRYRRAVQRELENGATAPPRFSEFLKRRAPRSLPEPDPTFQPALS